jgi:hypothetical protein
MKKTMLIASVACAIGVMPILSSAATNPFTQLVNRALQSTNESCGATSDPGFCSCFTNAVVTGCQTQPAHPPCNAKDIKAYMKTIYHDDYTVICNRFPPAGVPKEVCVEDLGYWDKNCPI